MVKKKLDFDPTLARYNAPFMDDNDAKNTGGESRIVPIFERAVSLAVKTKGLRTMVASGVDRSTFPHRAQANEFEQLIKKTGMTRHRLCRPARSSTPGCWAGMVRSARSPKASSLTSSRRAGRSCRRHHAASQGELRDEGREGRATRLERLRHLCSVGSPAQRGEATAVWRGLRSGSSPGCGRDDGCPPPPAQNRTCRFTASGSHLG